MTCQECGSNINKKFCSKRCYNLFRANKNKRNCQRCGKEFHLKNSAYEKRGGGLFCSKSCRAQKYELNHTFFDQIDTEEKAYWLGFIFADGNNSGTALRITLQTPDKTHLEKLVKHLGSTHPIYEYKAKNFRLKKKLVLQIGNKHLSNSLLELGCIPNKTFTLQFPNIPPKLHRHFIRGYFDGDGTIGIMNKKYGYKKWSIYTASIKFADMLHCTLQSCGFGVRKSTNRKGGIVIYLSRKNEIPKMFNYLYDGATIFMDRKKNKF